MKERVNYRYARHVRHKHTQCCSLICLYPCCHNYSISLIDWLPAAAQISSLKDDHILYSLIIPFILSSNHIYSPNISISIHHGSTLSVYLSLSLTFYIYIYLHLSHIHSMFSISIPLTLIPSLFLS